ncbi:MAG: glycosyltransferase family 2 protein [bacterium]
MRELRYRASAIITNWNGRELLERCLPSVFVACERLEDYEIIVVDDCSNDGSPEYIKSNFPSVKVISTPRNVGFQRASNLGAEEAKHDILIMLNNDIVLREDSLPPLLEHFYDKPNVFGVGAKLYQWDETTFLAGKRIGIFEAGHFKLQDVPDAEGPSPTLFVTGGAAAFDRSKYLAIGGFDPIYHPLYWEDVDICYRAWKRGWSVLYEPRSVMYHKHRATISRQVKADRLRRITGRNSYIFLWKNITSRKMFRQHILFAPLFLLRDLLHLRFRFWASAFMALTRVGKVIPRRRREMREAIMSDEEVLKLIKMDRLRP